MYTGRHIEQAKATFSRILPPPASVFIFGSSNGNRSSTDAPQSTTDALFERLSSYAHVLKKLHLLLTSQSY